jgi:Gnt-I system high-affinity gluconate transporter
VFTIVRENKLPLLWVGLPMSIALSTMHSFLPPHPGPAAVSGTFQASMALTLVYGLVIAIPAAALIAFTWPRLSFVKKMNPSLPRGLIAEEDFPERELPSFAVCLGLVLIPIVLMGALATAEIFLPEENPVLHFLSFFGEAPIALLISLLVTTFVLGEKVARTERRRAATDDTVEATPAAAQVSTGTGTVPAPEPVITETRPSFTERAAAVGRSCTDSVKPMAIIILIIGAGGAFKQVLVDSGIADYIKLITEGWNVSPIILA